ncbi:hypothetical protein [Kineococcus aurantiacus]|uniref:Uncharacterized protein n=1 Tax=Kineococcus aurantiacus TaxID=37633 RepID=A0A7Y9DJB7_9ACTN|nr:hypothetical protein [Kineococcus aurantiacus]NYD21794.1 hypothetical protein [Kineococcus aurantiacus]
MPARTPGTTTGTGTRTSEDVGWDRLDAPLREALARAWAQRGDQVGELRGRRFVQTRTPGVAGSRWRARPPVPASVSTAFVHGGELHLAVAGPAGGAALSARAADVEAAPAPDGTSLLLTATWRGGSERGSTCLALGPGPAAAALRAEVVAACAGPLPRGGRGS